MKKTSLLMFRIVTRKETLASTAIHKDRMLILERSGRITKTLLYAMVFK